MVLVTRYTSQKSAQLPCSCIGKYRMQLKASVISTATPTSRNRKSRQH
jgi:hypothetical protein